MKRACSKLTIKGQGGGAFWRCACRHRLGRLAERCSQSVRSTAWSRPTFSAQMEEPELSRYVRLVFSSPNLDSRLFRLGPLWRIPAFCFGPSNMSFSGCHRSRDGSREKFLAPIILKVLLSTSHDTNVRTSVHCVSCDCALARGVEPKKCSRIDCGVTQQPRATSFLLRQPSPWILSIFERFFNSPYPFLVELLLCDGAPRTL